MNKKKTKGTPDNVDVHVGQRLRVRRALLGMSQEKLAEAIGLTFQQIQKYERGVNRVSAGRLFQFSKILDVPVSYFYDQIGGGVAAQAAYGLSDNAQEPLGDDDVMQRKETLDLVRIYYSIDDPMKRKEILRFIKSMSDLSADA
ncbi:MAG: helix-turn-helix domain-containing protein [Bdellovibrionales bacterium]